MFFDTHAHFDSPDGPEIDALVARAAAAGVTRILAVGGSPAMNAAAIEAARRFPGAVRAAIGFDRDQAQSDPASLCAGLRETIRSPGAVRIAAVGELGLDFHYHPETAAAQIGLLRAQLALARELRLPVIVHSREADAETVAALGEHAAAWAGAPARVGVLHCFTGTGEFARRLLDLGFFISFSGIVTFRNADPLREVAAAVPDDRLLVETDSPYLAPVPHRGKRNEPAYIRHVAECLSRVRSTTPEHIAALTTANAERLFGPYS